MVQDMSPTVLEWMSIWLQQVQWSDFLYSDWGLAFPWSCVSLLHEGCDLTL